MPLQSVVRELLLNPGEYAVGDANCRMRTVLGSCVSITLWEPQRRFGAMSHFLLAGRGSAPGAALDARYGEEALTLMLRELAQVGVSAQQCQAKIFGGGNMFPEATVPGAQHVGRRNGESARSFLRELGIAVQSESLFGCGHRQIVFNVATGDVWSRQVQPSPGLNPLEGE
jgi:chemotaxis protein CheD